MNSLERTLLSIVSECGAANCAALPQGSIRYDRVFREICAGNACGNYGKCYMCPPDIGPIEALMERARRYPRAILYQTIHSISDSFDLEGMFAGGRAHSAIALRIEHALRDGGLSGYLHLGGENCGVCERCAKRDGLVCRSPEWAMPSLEAYGVYVAQTAMNAGLRYCNGANTVTFFGMILFSE